MSSQNLSFPGASTDGGGGADSGGRPVANPPGALRFGALGLAQLLIGDALLTNSRCLRFLAQQRSQRARAAASAGSAGATATGVLTDSLLSDQEMQALRRSIVRLGSHWRLLRGTELDQLARLGVARHKAVMALLPPGSAVGRAAKELLEQTEDPKGRAALREVMDQWVVSRLVRQVSAVDRDRLLELLEADAMAWQEAVDRVEPGNRLPILDGLRRCYRKPRRLARSLKGGADDVRLAQLHDLVTRNVAQLELLRPALSEPYAKQLWYLQRLERNLKRRLDLAAFEQKLYSMDLRTERLAKVQQRAQQAVQARAQVQEQRTGKLVALAYGPKPKAYADGIAADLSALQGRTLTLAESNLDQLSMSPSEQEPLNLGEITVEEPAQR